MLAKRPAWGSRRFLRLSKMRTNRFVRRRRNAKDAKKSKGRKNSSVQG